MSCVRIIYLLILTLGFTYVLAGYRFPFLLQFFS